LDFLIEGSLAVEIKIVEETKPVHEVEVKSFMRHLKVKYGALVNFHVDSIEKGISKIVFEDKSANG
jgi:GxxExxY protein